VREVFPRAGNALDPRLSTERAFRADFARHARHFRGERTELVHHRVDRVLQFQDFAADIDGDFLRQVTIRDWASDFGDVAHLAGEIAGHKVHRVGEIFPGSGDTAHVRLTAEFSFRTHFTRHPRYFRRE